MTESPSRFEQFSPVLAWQAFVPSGEQPWDEVRVAHLYRRIGFGAGWGTVRDGMKSSPGELVGKLLAAATGPDEPDFEAEVAALRAGVIRDNDPQQAKALWLYRILHSPYRLRERMTLFWHNHFATSNAKVRSIRLMQRQNETLRRHALGRFDSMLSEMTVDPAMLVWLDSASNVNAAPNENYAREVMELFSLGVGHYTEKDIQEAARALTGWKVVAEQAVFDPEQFDPREKTVFGRTGRWTSGDVARLCLSHEDCARFIVRKMFREFISENGNPSESLLDPLISGFRTRNYDIAWLVETILRSTIFFSPAAIRQKVKSPCDFVLGTVIALEGRPGLVQLAQSCDQLGQSLLHPPSVKGWDGGPTWINSSTLLKRQNLAYDLTHGSGSARGTDPARLPGQYGFSGSRGFAEFFLRLFHQQVNPAALESIVAQLESERVATAAALYGDASGEAGLARSAAHLAMTLPEYQLG